MIAPHKRRLEYSRKVFAMRQIRDCVTGSDAVKRSGELYAPMPSGMRLMNQTTATASTGQANPLTDRSISISEAPWYNSNPAYSAYIHRAKFPDIASNTLRGLLGVATREDPEVKLPGTLSYLEELATLDGYTIYDLYELCLSEVFQVGRHALVIDVRPDNTLYIAQYASETYINWQMQVVDGHRVQTYAEFETCEYNDAGEETKKSLIYSLEAEPDQLKRVCVVYRYTNGKLDAENGRVVLMIQGKSLDFLPVVNIGSERNDPQPDVCPLLGLTDCALDIYRHSADLNQAHFMTCNPTLLFTGVDNDDAPKVIGSTVAICLSDPASDGKYLATDTSALSHVQGYIQDVFSEAIQYGASLLGPSKRAAESAEALSLRQSSSSATLVTIVSRVGAAIQETLDMAAKMVGGTGAEFNPNYEFAELTLTSPDILALLNSWMSGGISRLTFLENMQAAGILIERTPEEEISQMEDEGIVPAPDIAAADLKNRTSAAVLPDPEDEEDEDEEDAATDD
jgi:Domain of unknown function (DUF4055)